MSGNTNTDIWIAGAAAAFTVDLLVYPLDTLKTRLQAPDYKKRFTNGAAGTVNRAALFRGLYQGVGSVIIATLPSSGAFFTTYEGVKHVLSNVSSKDTTQALLPQPIVHATASATAELVSCAILTPAEVIKQNAQMVGTSPSSSNENATLQTLRKFRGNPLALWSGYSALAGRNLPFTALQFPMFEWIKARIKAYREQHDKTKGTVVEGAAITAISAGTAGSIAAVITTPVDVVKTRVMLAATENTSKSQPQSPGKKGLVNAIGSRAKGPRKSSLQIARSVIAEDGVRGLWRGGALRGVWTMVGSGLYLGVYEGGRMYLAKRRGETVDPEDLI